MIISRISITIVIIVVGLLTFGQVFAQSFSNSGQATPVIPLFGPPRDLSLCGERVPLERQEVWESMDQALIVAVYSPSQVILWTKRAHRYFPYIEKRLKEKNMPADLKYIVIAESALKTYALSSAKACGPWQFMSGTGKKYGLRIDKWIDERLHFEKATEAALSYLSDLYGRFNNWNLAIAAYNCGENGMGRRTTQQETRLFYDTDLPLETEAYIFRILAAKLILSNPEAYGYHIPNERRYPPLQYDRVSVNFSREVSIMAIARTCETTYKTIKELNPEILQDALPAGHFKLKLPKGKAQKFNAVFNGSTIR